MYSVVGFFFKSMCVQNNVPINSTDENVNKAVFSLVFCCCFFFVFLDITISN